MELNNYNNTGNNNKKNSTGKKAQNYENVIGSQYYNGIKITKGEEILKKGLLAGGKWNSVLKAWGLEQDDLS